MNLYILYPKNGVEWPYYDSNRSFIIRAKSAVHARKLANIKGGDENNKHSYPWLNKDLTICRQLKADGEAKIIMIETING